MALTKKQQLNELLQAAIDSYHAGQIDRAIKHLVGAASDFPKAAKLWGYLGFLYSEVGEDVKAVHAYRKAVALSSHSEQASLGLFHSLWNLGKTSTAFDEMRRFIKSSNSPRYRQLIREMLAESPGASNTRLENLVTA